MSYPSGHCCFSSSGSIASPLTRFTPRNAGSGRDAARRAARRGPSLRRSVYGCSRTRPGAGGSTDVQGEDAASNDDRGASQSLRDPVRAALGVALLELFERFDRIEGAVADLLKVMKRRPLGEQG